MKKLLLASFICSMLLNSDHLLLWMGLSYDSLISGATSLFPTESMFIVLDGDAESFVKWGSSTFAILIINSYLRFYWSTKCL